MNYLDEILRSRAKAPPEVRYKRIADFLIETKNEYILAIAIINFLTVKPKNSIHANLQLVKNLPAGQKEWFLAKLEDLVGGLPYEKPFQETKH